MAFSLQIVAQVAIWIGGVRTAIKIVTVLKDITVTKVPAVQTPVSLLTHSISTDFFFQMKQMEVFYWKSCDIFNISAQTICCVYTLVPVVSFLQ